METLSIKVGALIVVLPGLCFIYDSKSNVNYLISWAIGVACGVVSTCIIILGI